MHSCIGFTNHCDMSNHQSSVQGSRNATRMGWVSEVVRKYPERELSPAEIQLFLLENRQSFHLAAMNIQECVSRSME